MPDPRLLREIHQLRGSGFSFIGDSIYHLRGEFFGKEVRIILHVEGVQEAEVQAGGVSRRVSIPQDRPLAAFLQSEIKRVLEVSFLREEGFAHKDEAGSIILTGSQGGKQMEIALPPGYPEAAARITMNGHSFEETVPHNEFIYTRLGDIAERVEAGKDKRLLLKRNFQEIERGRFVGRLEGERVEVRFPQGYPKSPPTLRLGIVHPRLTDDESYVKLENLKSYQWGKDPDLAGVLDAVQRRIERVHREVPRLYLEAQQLLHRTPLRPAKGNLERWEGKIDTYQGIPLELVVEMPREFPRVPPKVSLSSVFPNEHIDMGGALVIPRLTSEWSEDTHVVDILEDIKHLERTDLVSLDPAQRLAYEDSYLGKYEPSITRLAENQLAHYAQSFNAGFSAGWTVTITGEGVLTGRSYTVAVLLDHYFPAHPPVITFTSGLDVTERILLFGAIYSPTGVVLFGRSGSGMNWSPEMSVCEAMEMVKERLRVHKFEITSSEEFFEEIGDILVSDMVGTFKPLANNIYLWSGEYKAMYGAQLKKVHYEVRLSQNYPLSPPRVSIVDPKPFINEHVEGEGMVKEEFITQKHFRHTDLKSVVKLVKSLRPQPKKGIIDKLKGVLG